MSSRSSARSISSWENATGEISSEHRGARSGHAITLEPGLVLVTATRYPLLATRYFSADMNLKPETSQRIDEVITHYPSKRSATLPLLHLIQEDVGYIPEDAIPWVATKLEIQPINVYEVVTFYPMFRQKPIGRRHIKVCRTLSCALVGGYKTCDAFQKAFNTHLGEVSPDGEVTVDFVECLASCGTAPVVLIDDDLYEKVDVAKAQQLSAQIKSEAGRAKVASSG
jgi:NADH-quinone oxidoreductase subunit E